MRPAPGLGDDVLANFGYASVLAHENVLTRMSAADPPIPSVFWPTKTFFYRMYSMYLNGEGIQVIHQPAAHTDGDVIVFFRRGDVIATGDLIDTTRFPFIDVERGGTLQGELDALNRLMDLSIHNVPLLWYPDRTLLVPGHGHVYDKLDLLEYRDAITIVRDRVQDGIDRGHDARASPGRQSDAGLPQPVRHGFRSVDDRDVRRRRLQRARREEGHAMSRARTTVVVAASVIALCLVARVDAQRPAAAAPPPPVPRAAAPIDLTGYWVSIVTQDWRWRMVTPAKGDYQGVPLTPEGRAIADAWDPAKDEAAGEQCRSYGAPALMSVPGRLHITWADDSTLKVETDAGMQTRLLRFGDANTPADTPRTWQGVSVAQWQTPRPNVPLLLRPAERTADAPAVVPTGGSLRVVTTNLRAGYLRKNGVPYSENAVLTEHWDVYKRPNGEEWLTITTQVDDPQYLRTPRLVAPVFKKEPNGAKWDPTPCSSQW